MVSEHGFEELFKPGKIGCMTLKNRLVMPPMATNFASEEGRVTERLMDHYKARAYGGFGLVIVEYTCVDSPEGRASRNQLVIDDDKCIPGLKKLADTIKSANAKAAIQLHHVGRGAKSSITGCQPVGPSPIPMLGGEIPRELSEEEISSIVNCFARAAHRAKEAGFDGVEIHGAHGYLLSQFLSAASNQRTDCYGGSVENRARLLTGIIKAIRKMVGRDYPLWCRVNGVESGVKNGITIEETKQVAVMAQEAGANAIHVSAQGAALQEEQGALIKYAEAVKKVVAVPVITVGRITPEIAKLAISQDKADFVAIGRPNYADAQIVNKMAEGRLEDIKSCIYCNECLGSLYASPDGVHCTVNPLLGREKEYAITRAEKSKKVLVIGGGPAGMEAARVAASRGHSVVLYEKCGKLGGQLLTAKVAPGKQAIGELISYLSKQLEKLGVWIHLNTEVTGEIVGGGGYDAVILAAGSSPLMPNIKGIGNKNVFQAVDVLSGQVNVGDSVVVIGGELIGCETAHYLAETGREVTIMRRGSHLAEKVSPLMRYQLLNKLSRYKNINIMTGVKYEEITAGGVVITDKNGKKQTVKADSVILAAGAKPNNGLLPLLKRHYSELYSVGDCVEPRNIKESVKEAYLAALAL